MFIPIAVAAGLAIFALMASKHEAQAKQLPPGETSKDKPPGGDEVHPATQVSAPPGELKKGTTPNTGDKAVAHADDSFDAMVAAAIAMGDTNVLSQLADEAEKKGLLTVARSIRAEIARLKNEAPKPTPDGADKPAPVTHLATYVVKKGDTGSSIAQAFTGNSARWKELLPVNPGTKDAKYGFKANVGQRINLPASWPAGIPVVANPPPGVAAVVAPAPAPIHSYVVKAGDTGQKVAQAFTGDMSRWKELLTVNPSLKSEKYGIALYTGHRINLPASWPDSPSHSSSLPVSGVTKPVALPAVTPEPAAPPPPAPLDVPPESPARTAARELTAYLTSIGGLAGRFKEDRKKVAGYLAAMGVPDSTGMYGRQGAGAVMQNGYVPVVPFYWPTTGIAKAKSDFTNLVKSFSAADPQRELSWTKLLSDIQRA